MKSQKLEFITTVCAIASGVVAFFLLILNTPVDSPGYGKVAVLIWPFLAFIVFGLLWPVAVFGDYIIRPRRRYSRVPNENNSRMLGFIAIVLFCLSTYYFYMLAADKIHKRQLFHFATASQVDERAASELVDSYLRISQDGLLNGDYCETAVIALLNNPSTPPSVIEKVGVRLHSSSSLWQILSRHPLLPSSVIEQRISDPLIGEKLATNPKLPEKYLRLLAESPDRNVRIIVSRNVSTPNDSLEKLAQENDSIIRDFARKNLAGKLGRYAYK